MNWIVNVLITLVIANCGTILVSVVTFAIGCWAASTQRAALWTWRRQLIGTRDHETAKEINGTAIVLQEQIAKVRRPYRQQRADGSGVRGSNEDLLPVSQTLARLQVALRTGREVWGDKYDNINYVRPLEECVWQLLTQVRAWENRKPDEKFPFDMSETMRIVFTQSGKDAFAERVDKEVRKIEKSVRRHLR